MSGDDTVAAVAGKASDDVFEFGDRTIYQLRNQTFALDELGTVVSRPASAGASAISPTVPSDTPGTAESPAIPIAAGTDAAADAVAADPLQRIERKLDALIHTVNAIHRRLDSVDVAIAKTLVR